MWRGRTATYPIYLEESDGDVHGDRCDLLAPSDSGPSASAVVEQGTLMIDDGLDPAELSVEGREAITKITQRVVMEITGL